MVAITIILQAGRSGPRPYAATEEVPLPPAPLLESPIFLNFFPLPRFLLHEGELLRHALRSGLAGLTQPHTQSS